MPLYQWTSIELEQHDKGTGEEAIKATKGTRDALLHLENEEVHSPTDPPTEALHHEEHASNVDKWATSHEIARRERNKKGSTSSTTMTTSRLASRPPRYLAI